MAVALQSKPLILFPGDYSDSDTVDASFADEFKAASVQASLSVALFDQRAFEEQGVMKTSFDSDLAAPTVVVYRGWMMKPEEYQRFYQALVDKGAKMITSPEEYVNLRLFPNSYKKLIDNSPKIFIFGEDDVDYQEIVRAFDRFVTKDHIKSAKGFDFSTVVDSRITKDDLKGLLARFKNFRGELFTGGYVFKRCVEYKRRGDKTNKWRCFYLNGRCLTIERNSGQPKRVPEPPDSLIFKYSNLDSHFYTVDFAETDKGDWTIVDVGDGQVSGLASGQDVMSYYTGFAEALNHDYPVYDLAGIHAKLEGYIKEVHERWDNHRELFDPDTYEYFIRDLEKHIEGSLAEFDGYMQTRRSEAYKRRTPGIADAAMIEMYAIDDVQLAIHPRWVDDAYRVYVQECELAADEERWERWRLTRLAKERRGSIDLSIALRRNNPDTELPEWIWCLGGRIIEVYVDSETHSLANGTEQFRPGTSVYCLEGSWDEDAEEWQVVGLVRGSREIVKTGVNKKLIHDFRLTQTCDKRIIRSGNTTWNNTDEAQLLIMQLVKTYNEQAKKTQRQLYLQVRDIAFELARKAHEGQYDKGGKPYIEHPLAVEKLLVSPRQRIVALLHDVVEDTDTTLEDLRPFGKEIVAAVDAITKRDNEPLKNYLTRVKANPIARAVKIADLTHNSDLSRIPNPTQEDYDRAERYRKEIGVLKRSS
jgi:hypothetical protein